MPGLPDTVLLNGGVFHAHAMVQRLTQLLAAGAAARCACCTTRTRTGPWRAVRQPTGWRAQQGCWHRLLRPTAPEARKGSEAIKPAWCRAWRRLGAQLLAAAAGQEGRGPQGLCLLPRGTEEGVRMVLSGRRFALKLGQAVRFNLLANSQATARAGRPDCTADGDGWVELPPLATVLPAPEGRSAAQVEVQLQACMSEVGTLEVRCVAVQDAGQSWLLPFPCAVRRLGCQLRSAAER
jgi:hypothetical protein